LQLKTCEAHFNSLVERLRSTSKDDTHKFGHSITHYFQTFAPTPGGGKNVSIFEMAAYGLDKAYVDTAGSWKFIKMVDHTKCGGETHPLALEVPLGGGVANMGLILSLVVRSEFSLLNRKQIKLASSSFIFFPPFFKPDG
jgi:hypothetical protein